MAVQTQQVNYDTIWKWLSEEEMEKSRANDPAFGQKRIDYYNEIAAAYDSSTAEHKFTGPRRNAEALHKYLKGGAGLRIMDIGGGTGMAADELRKLGPYKRVEVEAVDPSEGMLKVALDRQLYSKVYCQYFYVDCGLPRDHYDGILCCGAFVPGHLKSSSLHEMWAITKSGGYITICMKVDYLVDPDLAQLRGVIQELQAAGKWQVLEDYTFDGYFDDYRGQIWVLRKL